MGYEAPEITLADISDDGAKLNPLTPAEILTEINKLLTCTTNKITDAVVAHIDADISSVGITTAAVRDALCIGASTVALFQANAGTGDCTGPEKVNDGATVDPANFALNQYATVDFGAVYRIKQYRHYGNNDNNNDGTFKLQYWDGTDWVDWDSFTTRAASWTSFVDVGNDISVRVIRILCSVLDSNGANKSYLGELELKL